jgi:hypothetical protein
MNSGGTIEIAQRIAGHNSPATTRIYDRSGDQLTLEEIERVQIGKKHPQPAPGLHCDRRFPHTVASKGESQNSYRTKANS